MDQTINVFELPADVQRNREVVSGSCAVVIDVLRSTTTLTYAFGAGLSVIIPVLRVEDALAFRSSGISGVILGGERGCRRIEQFDVSNSPSEMRPEVVKGKTMVFTSTNGALAMIAANTAKKIALGSFVNIDALTDELKTENRIVIICSGTEGKITSEDILLAGLITEKLKEKNNEIILDPIANSCLIAWNKESKKRSLLENLRISDGAKKLLQCGFDKDIEAAAKYNEINIVPHVNFNKINYEILGKNAKDYL
jgi:2-phosphosulfolactate phosphatase